MKKKLPLILFLLVMSFSASTLNAQLRKIPAIVTDAFKEKYPNATGVEWRDKLSSFIANFAIDGVSYEAKYNTKGQWQSTESELNKEKLPADVNDGLDKSKYADWSVDRVQKIDFPADKTEFRLLVKKDAAKKNLLFSNKGRLISEKVTL